MGGGELHIAQLAIKWPAKWFIMSKRRYRARREDSDDDDDIEETEETGDIQDDQGGE